MQKVTYLETTLMLLTYFSWSFSFQSLVHSPHLEHTARIGPAHPPSARCGETYPLEDHQPFQCMAQQMQQCSLNDKLSANALSSSIYITLGPMKEAYFLTGFVLRFS